VRLPLNQVSVSYPLPQGRESCRLYHFDGHGFQRVDHEMVQRRASWVIDTLVTWELYLVDMSGEASRGE